MHKHNRHGFTLVELMVVIVVIAILSTIAILSYTIVLKQTHDSKRQSDMTALQTTLQAFYQKNGAYPSGCIMPNASSSVGCSVFSSSTSASTTGVWTMYSDTTVTDQINASSTNAQIQTILPGIDQTFGDPNDSSPTPIENATSSPAGYIYIGGLMNPTTASAAATYYVAASASPGSGHFSCALWFTLQPGQYSSYVIGYFDEEDGTWHLQNGPHNVQVSYGGTASALSCAAGGSGAQFAS
ncbi:MAG TPA: prepilin-type N-terminal cleavage/methylation domain-containing protein [Candidatus Saccharimonadaceae bacterium]|nr:prepilin-type N-terminal cleavage/methylation domain-containing protein [Candidatus Saccharimonadaceae bacterium]